MAANKIVSKHQGLPHDQISSFDMGYAMGFIAGEGSFSFRGNYTIRSRGKCYRRGGYAYTRLNVKLHVRDVKPLEFLQKLFGGRINGPYTEVQVRKDGTKREMVSLTWILDGRALYAALPLFRKYLPMSYKRIQFLEWELKHGLTEVNVGDTNHQLESEELARASGIGVTNILTSTETNSEVIN